MSARRGAGKRRGAPRGPRALAALRLIGAAGLLGAASLWPVASGLAQSGSPSVSRRGPVVQVDLHVIGFAVSPAVEAQLRAMAEAGGGRYHRSADEAELMRAMGQAAGVAPPPAAPAAGPVTSQEREPNDRLAGANPIAPSGEIEGAIQRRGDADWYRVAVAAQGALAFTTRTVPAGIDLVLRAWDENGRPIGGWFGPPRIGAETTGVVDLPRPGTYWLEVRDGGDNAFAAEPYRLALAFTPTADAGEPNDTMATAQPLALGAAVSANILPRGDVDWYRVAAPRQGALALAVTGVDERLDVVVRVWNADGKPSAWLTPARRGGDTVAVVDLPGAGDYWLEVRDGNDDARAERPYTLAVRFTPAADTGEPNDTLATAQPLLLDARLRANILPRGDVDWYRVEAPARGALALRVTEVADNLDVVVRVWTPSRQPLGGWLAPPRRAGDTIAVVDLPGPGPYWLEVRDGNDDARSEQPYALALAFTPAPDAGEPNDSLAQATPLPLGAPVEATILPRGDVDVYRFETGGPGTLELAITEQADHLDVVARIWNADLKPVTGWLGPPRRGADTRAAVKLAEAGTHYLEVRDGNDDARSERPYRLLATFSGPLPPLPVAAAPPPVPAPSVGAPAPDRAGDHGEGSDELLVRLRGALAATAADALPQPPRQPAADPAGPPPGPRSPDDDLLDALERALSAPSGPR